MKAPLLLAVGFLCVFCACNSPLPSGRVTVYFDVSSRLFDGDVDTSGHDKYQVEAMLLSTVLDGNGDPDPDPKFEYHVKFWTRDEQGVLHVHGAVVDALKDRTVYDRATYQWHSDSTITIRLESNDGEDSHEMQLYGWKNTSGARGDAVIKRRS